VWQVSLAAAGDRMRSESMIMGSALRTVANACDLERVGCSWILLAVDHSLVGAGVCVCLTCWMR
jgi:hypothetical protein